MEDKKDPTSSGEITRAINAYHAAIELRKLGSDQVHSRPTAMLTGNTIILVVCALAITNMGKLPSDLIVALIIGGLTLCLIWGFFVFMSLQTENHYRKKIEEFEQLASPHDRQLVVPISRWKTSSYGIGTYLTIAVLVAMYATLLVIIINR